MQAIIYDLEEFNAQLEFEFDEDEVLVEWMGINNAVLHCPQSLKDKEFLEQLCKIHSNRAALSKEEENWIRTLANRFI